MIMDKLLSSCCFLPGEYKLKEGNASVSIVPEQGESILFFSIDDQSNPQCTFRSFLWGKTQGKSLCDGLVFYTKGDRRALCFLELKEHKSDFHKAVEQVTNTLDGVKDKIEGKQPLFLACLIADHGSPAKEQPADIQKLKSTFKENNFVYNGNLQSFAALLRGVKLPTATQKRKENKKRGK